MRVDGSCACARHSFNLHHTVCTWGCCTVSPVRHNGAGPRMSWFLSTATVTPYHELALSPFTALFDVACDTTTSKRRSPDNQPQCSTVYDTAGAPWWWRICDDVVITSHMHTVQHTPHGHTYVIKMLGTARARLWRMCTGYTLRPGPHAAWLWPMGHQLQPSQPACG